MSGSFATNVTVKKVSFLPSSGSMVATANALGLPVVISALTQRLLTATHTRSVGQSSCVSHAISVASSSAV